MIKITIDWEEILQFDFTLEKRVPHLHKLGLSLKRLFYWNKNKVQSKKKFILFNWDRYLQIQKNLFKLCILPDFAVYNFIPVEKWDQKVDEVFFIS